MRKILITFLLILIPVYSFAFIDIAGYGGYGFGEYEEKTNNVSDDLDGCQYGVFGHLGGGIGAVFSKF